MRPLRRDFQRESQPLQSVHLPPRQVCFGTGETWTPAQSYADQHHPGELELGNDEDDFWADHDEDCGGPIDTKEMREEFPEGFTWDCCDQVGTAPGCTKGHHYAIEGKRRKPTMDDFRLRLRRN